MSSDRLDPHLVPPWREDDGLSVGGDNHTALFCEGLPRRRCAVAPIPAKVQGHRWV